MPHPEPERREPEPSGASLLAGLTPELARRSRHVETDRRAGYSTSGPAPPPRPRFRAGTAPTDRPLSALAARARVRPIALRMQ